MNNQTSEQWDFPWVVLAGLVLLVLLAVMVWMRFSGARIKSNAETDVKAAVAEQARIETQSSAGHDEPVCVHAAAVAPVADQIEAPPVVQAVEKKDDFIVDYEILRAREVARKQMIDDLRQKLKEDDGGGSALSEDQIKQLEKSGDTLR